MAARAVTKLLTPFSTDSPLQLLGAPCDSEVTDPRIAPATGLRHLLRCYSRPGAVFNGHWGGKQGCSHPWRRYRGRLLRLVSNDSPMHSRAHANRAKLQGLALHQVIITTFCFTYCAEDRPYTMVHVLISELETSPSILVAKAKTRHRVTMSSDTGPQEV
jgi:hypothetical protein